jgi:hypothetical protein
MPHCKKVFASGSVHDGQEDVKAAIHSGAPAAATDESQGACSYCAV